MTPAEMKALFPRKEDKIAIAELACLDGRELQVFIYRYINNKSIDDISDICFRSYSVISHICSSVRKKLATIPADI